MKSHFKTIKALPEHLQPKILSAVAYINECSPDMKKAVERINTLLDVSNETQIKINALRKQLEKIDKLKKDEDEIPF